MKLVKRLLMIAAAVLFVTQADAQVNLRLRSDPPPTSDYTTFILRKLTLRYSRTGQDKNSWGDFSKLVPGGKDMRIEGANTFVRLPSGDTYYGLSGTSSFLPSASLMIESLGFTISAGGFPFR